MTRLNIGFKFLHSWKLARFLVLLSTLLAFSPFSFSQNLLTNPGFENGTSGWTLDGDASAQFTESNGRSGNRLTHWSSSSSYSAETKQTVTGLAAGIYRLSVYTVGGETSGAWLWADCDGQSFSTPIPSSPWGSWVQVVVDNISVSGGSCQLGMTTENSEWSSFDDVVFERVSGGGPSEIVIEEGTGYCDVDGSVDSNHSGYNGSGFANTDNAAGNGIDWRVQVPTSGNYELEWRYANASENNRAGSVMVNGNAVTTVDFPSTGAWETWTVATATISLDAGENTIRLEAVSGEGLGNIDSLSVTGDSPQAIDCGNNSGDGYPLGNAPVPSAGCGQSPGLASGTHTMTSAGLNREYIVSLPNNYDPNKPYRLVFGMHWANGSAEAVAGWSQWFGLKALDTGNNTIFVAPNGYNEWWSGSDDRDHIFFDDLNAHLASNLCVDKSRIFSVGFSLGAMYTNGLAQTHQDVLRGVVVYATADYNIYFPDNTGEPLAYMGVHGLHDPTCPISSGRRSRDRFVANNACMTPGSVPEAWNGGPHVTYDYDCPDNYPVRWSTFDGAHSYPPNDEPIGSSWVHGETWEFITQF